MIKNNWSNSGWIDRSWTLPSEARERLSKIYPPDAIPAVEKACQFYLALIENENSRPPVSSDGRDLLAIAQAAEQLASLLNRRNCGSALKRLKLHIIGRWTSGMSTKGIAMGRTDGLVADLCFLANAARDTPAAKDVGKKKRPTDSRKEAQKSLAFFLWNAYKDTHGKPPGRVVDTITGKECGPMVQAMEVLKPLLGTGSTLDRAFREINKAYREMDNKSKPE